MGNANLNRDDLGTGEAATMSRHQSLGSSVTSTSEDAIQSPSVHTKNYESDTSLDTVPKPPPGMPPKWRWPPWALNHRKPEIEVYVTDDAAGLGKWCKAEPRSRILDEHQQARPAYNGF